MGIFINRNFVKATNVIVVVDSDADLFLLDYAGTTVKSTNGSIALIDTTTLASPGRLAIKDAFHHFTESVKQSNILPQKVLTPDLLIGYNFMLISYNTWNHISEHHRAALQQIP